MDIQEAISEFKMENALLGVRNPMKVARNDLAISALQEQAEREKGCEWRLVDDDGEISTRYETDCGHSFFFEDGSTEENGFTTCPYCGKRLK
jgi:DNA-directed RNA polymerase subunit RPC12/RpoP